MAPSAKDTKDTIKNTAPTPSNQNNESSGSKSSGANSQSSSSGGGGGGGQKKSLKETVEQDPTKIGDPVSVQVGEDKSPVGGDLDNERAGVKKDESKKGSKL